MSKTICDTCWHNRCKCDDKSPGYTHGYWPKSPEWFDEWWEANKEEIAVRTFVLSGVFEGDKE